MSARFLMRFDDLCPTMNWDAWDGIESVLVRSDVRPILSVVPDNQDPKLNVGSPRPDFWERVRSWQKRGWSIGLHGYQHKYVTQDPGLVGLNTRSEFAGLPIAVQGEKIDRALQIFHEHNVRPDLWIAPGHSFDRSTIEVLRARGIRTISDGLFVSPVTWHGMVWIPQQLWRFRNIPTGVWTVCFHPNSFADAEHDSMARDVREFRDRLVSLQDVTGLARPIRSVDKMGATIWVRTIKGRRALLRRRSRQAQS